MSTFNNLKKSIIAAMVLSGVSVTASAGWEEIAGGATGAVIGSRFGGGSGKTIATVVGGVAGYEIAGAMKNSQNNQNNQNNQQVNQYPNQSSQQYQTMPQANNQQQPQQGGSMLGTIGGGAIGAIIGSRFGGGNGKTVMTVLGGIGGAMLGNSMTRPNQVNNPNGQLVMTGADGRQWVNGTEPLNPQTELPAFKNELNQTRSAFLTYMHAVNRVQTAKSDLDWKRISINEYNNHEYEAQQASYNFERSKNSLWELTSTAAVNYNKHINEDDLVMIASCNAVPRYDRNIDLRVIIQNGMECGDLSMNNQRMSVR